MMGNLLLRRPKLKKDIILNQSRQDLLGFVSRQFKELIKKNLQVPIKLYQL